ncbi:hypothetical protein [Massilia sp.]|uniref:hypothetical protein n=1 Tax=Massilia sp. TaxID=1882437 RepID=UPI0028A05E60|nr:hypothetical protein [Massilia sp.]
MWHKESDVYGVAVKGHFFDADAAMREVDLALRVLPLLQRRPPKVLFTERDRKNFYYGELVAQPDAVFEHGAGLIALEYKSMNSQPHSHDAWQREIRVKDMLQCMLAGYAVAQSYQRTTACVLRYHNVCYLLTPSPAVMETMLSLIPMAKQYYGDERRVSASQLAQFSVERVRKQYPGPKDERSDQGRVAHDEMFKQ